MRPTPFLALVAAFAAAGCDRPSPAPGQGDAATAATPDEVPSGGGGGTAAPVKTFDRSHKGEAAPAHGFTGPDGKATTLGAFRGRPVLVNLWATWCGPCVKELPTLDRLAATGRVAVVALSQDGDAAKANAFFAQRDFGALEPYTDPKMQWLGGFTATLPTTVLYGADGRERWRFTGDLDWTGAEAKAALGEA